MTVNRFARPANFASRVRTPLLREHVVYRVFDADGDLLYVGCTLDLKGRLSAHRGESREWHPKMARLKVSGPYNYETARQLERDAIYSERPIYNGQTPERVAVLAAHDRIYKRRHRALMAAGLDFFEAYELAKAHANCVLPKPPGRGPLRADDATVPRALRLDREDAARYEVAA